MLETYTCLTKITEPFDTPNAPREEEDCTDKLDDLPSRLEQMKTTERPSISSGLTFLRAADLGMSSPRSRLGWVPLQAWSRQADIAWNKQLPSPGT